MALREDQLPALKTELETDPLGRGYAGMTAEQAADDLNSVYRPYSKNLEIPDFAKLMRGFGKWDDFKADQENRAVTPRTAEMMDMFYTQIDSIDLRGHPNRIAKEPDEFELWLSYGTELLDAMVAEGTLGAAAADIARTYCDDTVARSWELFDVQVTSTNVTDARALP